MIDIVEELIDIANGDALDPDLWEVRNALHRAAREIESLRDLVSVKEAALEQIASSVHTPVAKIRGIARRARSAKDVNNG